jgi:hypothetical protein
MAVALVPGPGFPGGEVDMQALTPKRFVVRQEQVMVALSKNAPGVRGIVVELRAEYAGNFSQELVPLVVKVVLQALHRMDKSPRLVIGGRTPVTPDSDLVPFGPELLPLLGHVGPPAIGSRLISAF